MKTRIPPMKEEYKGRGSIEGGVKSIHVKYLRSRCMAPQELKNYILHDVYVMDMVSARPGSKTAYFVISKNRPISRLKTKMF